MNVCHQAYLFSDYWEDIGTIKSFFDSNLALTEQVIFHFSKNILQFSCFFTQLFTIELDCRTKLEVSQGTGSFGQKAKILTMHSNTQVGMILWLLALYEALELFHRTRVQFAYSK